MPHWPVAFSFSCKKEKKDCGCDAPTIGTLTNSRGKLAYDPLSKCYYILTISGNGPIGTINYLCNAGIIPDSIKQRYMDKQVIFSGEVKPLSKCKNWPAVIAVYSQIELKLQEVRPVVSDDQLIP